MKITENPQNIYFGEPHPGNEELKEIESTPQNQSIEVSLRKGLTASFRYPIATDMMLAEQSIDEFTGDFPIDFYRAVARQCCTNWGGSSSMPDESKIRSADDTNVGLAFIKLVGDAAKEASQMDSYAELIEEGSSKPGFDAVRVRLSSGKELLFDEPTQADNKRRENTTGNIEANLVFASTLCRSIDGAELSLAEYRLFFNNLGFKDFFRVNKALTEFFR